MVLQHFWVCQGCYTPWFCSSRTFRPLSVMHRANEVRPVLDYMGKLAEQYDFALLIIEHSSKPNNNSAVFRGLGSMDIQATARSVLVVGRNPEDPEQRVMAHLKASNAEEGASLLFRISEDGMTWEGGSELTADEILDVFIKSRKKKATALEAASDFLVSILEGKENVNYREIIRQSGMFGIGERTLYNAKNALGVETTSLGKGESRITWWRLPRVEGIPQEQTPEQTVLGSPDAD